MASESRRAFAAESGLGRVLSACAFLTESARIESLRALSFSAESAAARSQRKNDAPIDHVASFPSALHPMKSPPMRVRRFTGNGAAVGSDTLIDGISPPSSGSVTT